MTDCLVCEQPMTEMYDNFLHGHVLICFNRECANWLEAVKVEDEQPSLIVKASGMVVKE